MISSAPLFLYRPKCVSISPATILRLRSRTPGVLIFQLSLGDAELFALPEVSGHFGGVDDVLAGQTGDVGAGTATYFRSITAAFIPFLANAQARYLPLTRRCPAPLDRILPGCETGNVCGHEMKNVLAWIDVVLTVVIPRFWAIWKNSAPKQYAAAAQEFSKPIWITSLLRHNSDAEPVCLSLRRKPANLKTREKANPAPVSMRNSRRIYRCELRFPVFCPACLLTEAPLSPRRRIRSP